MKLSHLLGQAIIPAIFLSPALFAQSYTIQTIAGGGLPNNIPGTSASLGLIEGVAVDSNGNVFMTSGTYHCLFRLDAKTNILTVVAGTGIAGFSGDNGLAVNAQLNQPRGIALDAKGNIYVADTGNNLIREISGG